MYYTIIESKIGKILLIGNENGLSQLILNPDSSQININWKKNDLFFTQISLQLGEYFSNKRRTFDCKLNPQGTIFQKKVWEFLLTIPYGKLFSYKDVAKGIGNEKASRAVGSANNKNPIPIIIPCHRVVGSNGKLVGYAYGLDVKQKLIQLEEQS